MKKLIVASFLALSSIVVGCSEKPVVYDCGSESFAVYKDRLEVTSGKTKGTVFDYVSDGKFKILTRMGNAYYTINGSNIEVNVATYHFTLTCEVIK